MIGIYLFASGLIAHLIGDYLIQTEEEANQKAIRHFFNWPLLRHVLKYTLCLAIPMVWWSVSPIWILWIFATHYVLDRRAFVLWWRIHVMASDPAKLKETFWLTIMVDQIFHILALAVVCAFQ